MYLVCRFKAPRGGCRNLKFGQLYKYIYILTRHATSRTSNIRPAWDFAKINILNLVPLTKESWLPKKQSSWFDLAWFHSFESANWPLKSSTLTFESDGKFVSAYDLHKLPTQRHLRNVVSIQIWTRESQAACLAHEKHMQIVGNSKIYFNILIYFYHHIVALRCVAACVCAKQAAWDSRVQVCIENCIPEMPLSRQLVQIIGRNKFSIRFES